MSYKIVKIISGDDFETRENPVWCLAVTTCGDSATLCKGEYFGSAVSACKFETGLVDSGGVTCPECIKIITHIQSINLDD